MPSSTALARPRPGWPKLKTILVATDLSAGAEDALTRTMWLPLDPRARILLVRVQTGREMASPKTGKTLEDRLQHEAVRLQSMIRRSAPRVRVEPVLLSGEAHWEIAAYARRTGAELIVLGRHGQRRLADLLGLGTTAGRIVRVVDTPVLVVGRRARAPYRRPVAAIDRPTSPATRLAIGHGLRLIEEPIPWAALHVSDELFASVLLRGGAPPQEIAALHRRDGARVRTEIGVDLARRFPEVLWKPLVLWGEPRFLVTDTAAKHRADLIVLGARTRSTLGRWFLGSVAEAVLRRARCDVLIVSPTSGKPAWGPPRARP